MSSFKSSVAFYVDPAVDLIVYGTTRVRSRPLIDRGVVRDVVTVIVALNPAVLRVKFL
jgi:hypothetical protein